MTTHTGASFRSFRPLVAFQAALLSILIQGCDTDPEVTNHQSNRQSDGGPGQNSGETQTIPEPAAPRQWWELGMADPILDQVLLFYLGEAWQGATDTAECLETVARVDATDPYSWQREWRKTAERLGAVAESSERANHLLSAGQAYLRAASYYRAALHRHPNPSDNAVREMTELEVRMFTKYLSLSDSRGEAVQIPYENTTLPGYFFHSRLAQGNAPVVIVHEGRDAWAEDTKYLVDAALARGYHALAFDGPGMGKVIRTQGLPFRHDWENVITPVVDYVVRQPGVDPQRVALIGLSMGGYLAPRAAAFEHRLKLVVANPGVFDWGEIVRNFLLGLDPELESLLQVDSVAFDRRMAELQTANPMLRWALPDQQWHHGVTSPFALVKEMEKYTLRDVVGQIGSRMLVVDAEAEEYGQARVLYEALPGAKDYLLFTAAEAAQFHVQVGATAIGSARIFDWIETHL
ncbi:MAG TPA: alpha/beta fold hydrolase [Polyangiaceae bacterium]|nr:alpha/beta fold hydrolase [Polyangiaceae bacterium]